MRPVTLIAALAVGLACSAASAQTVEADARVRMLEHELEISRQRALAAEREAYAAQAQLRADLSVRSLESARAAASPPLSGPPPPLDPYLAAYYAPRSSLAPLNGQFEADSERLLQLQERVLARSNARILAVKPAN